MLLKATEKHSCSFKAVIICLLVSFSLMSVVPTQALAQGVFTLPAPGAAVPLSPGFVPVMLRGLQVNLENPFQFDFIVDSGNTGLRGNELRAESEKLAKYFLATLTTPEEELWVNLSPYEHDRIIPEDLGKTTMGQDLLTQDYILKQVTASLILPDSETGKVFWDKVYKKAYEAFGTTNIPTDTFNKVWIVPERAVVYEDTTRAIVTESHLKVMLESDYLAEQKSREEKEESRENKIEGRGENGEEPQAVGSREHIVSSEKPLLNNNDYMPTTDHSFASDIVREVLIPLLEHEVNEGKNFTSLRQMFHAMVLATWYKQALKTSILNRVYADQRKIKGLEVNSEEYLVNSKNKESATIHNSPDTMHALQDTNGQILDTVHPSQIDQIYQQYLAAYKKGVCDLVKVEQDPYTHKPVARKYFSGGFGKPGGKPISSAITRKPLATLTSSLARFIAGTAFAVAMVLGSPSAIAAGSDTKPLTEQSTIQQDDALEVGDQEVDDEDIALTAEEQRQEFISDPYSYIRKNLPKELEAEVEKHEGRVSERAWYQVADPNQTLGVFIRNTYPHQSYHDSRNNITINAHVVFIDGLLKNTGRLTYVEHEKFIKIPNQGFEWNTPQHVIVFADPSLRSEPDSILKNRAQHEFSYHQRWLERGMISLIFLASGLLAGIGGYSGYNKAKKRMLGRIHKVFQKGNVNPSVSFSDNSLVLAVGSMKIILTHDSIKFKNFFNLGIKRSDENYLLSILWMLQFLPGHDSPDLPQIKDFIWSCLDGLPIPTEGIRFYVDSNMSENVMSRNDRALDFLIERMVENPKKRKGLELMAMHSHNVINTFDWSSVSSEFLDHVNALSKTVAADIYERATARESHDPQDISFLSSIIDKLDSVSAQVVLHPFFEEMKEALQEERYDSSHVEARLELARATTKLLLSSQEVDLSMDEKKVLLSAVLARNFIAFWGQDLAESEEIARESSTRLTARIVDSLMSTLHFFHGGWAEAYWPTIFSFIKGTKDALGETSCDLLKIIFKGREINGNDLDKFEKQVVKFIDMARQNPETFKSKKVTTLAILFESTNQDLIDYILKISNDKLMEAFDGFTEVLFSGNLSSQAREYVLDYFLQNVSRDKQLSFLREMKAWCRTNIMQENSQEEWKIFLEHYYKDFGPLVSSDLFKVYKHLIQGKDLDAPEVQTYALDKALSQTGAEGIHQLKRQVDSLRKSIFQQEALTEEILTSPLLTALAVWILRFSAGSWSHGVVRGLSLSQIFSEYQQAQSTAPVLDENIRRNKAEAAAIHKMGSIDFTIDEKEMFTRYCKLFEQALDIVQGQKEEKIFSLMQNQWVEYLRAKENALMLDALEQQNPKARENIEKNIRILQELTRSVQAKEKMIDIEEVMIFNGNSFLLKDNDFSTLFNLSLIVDAFIQYPAQQEKIKEILENGLDVSALSGILTFKENLLKDHVLKDSEKASHILNVFKTKIFKEALERREKLEDTLDLKFRPITRGLFLALAGSFGNACYTKISVKDTLNHPTMVGAIPFSGDLGSGEQILGSVLILENQTKDDKVWILRAINPIEDLADNYNMEDFMRELIKVVRKRAPEDVKGVYLTLEPGATSNRPQINSLAKKFSSAKAEEISMKENFNGYNIQRVYRSILGEEAADPQPSGASPLTVKSQEDEKDGAGSLADIVRAQQPLFSILPQEEYSRAYKIPESRKEVVHLMKKMILGGKAVAEDVQRSLKAQDMMQMVNNVLRVQPSQQSVQLIKALCALVGEEGKEDEFMQTVEKLAEANPFAMFSVNTNRISIAEQAFTALKDKGIQNIARADTTSELAKNLVQHGGFGVVISSLDVEGNSQYTLDLSINRRALHSVDPLWNLARWRSANEHSDYNQHNYLMNRVEGGTPIFIASEDRFFAENGDFNPQPESLAVRTFKAKAIKRPRLDFPMPGKNISVKHAERVEKYTTDYRAKEKIINGTFMMMVSSNEQEFFIDRIKKAQAGDYKEAKNLTISAYGLVNNLRARHFITQEGFYDRAISDAQQGNIAALDFLVYIDKVYYWPVDNVEQIPSVIRQKVRTFLKTMDVEPYEDNIRNRSVQWSLDHASFLGNAAAKKVFEEQSSSAVGGIDLNAANLELKRTGSSFIQFNLPPEWQGVDLENIPGFVPVIINIVPIYNFQGFLGMGEDQTQQDFALSKG